MTEQNPPAAEEAADEATDRTLVTPPPTAAPASYPTMTRGQHLAAALRGRPVIIAASVITTLAVGLGGFALGLAVGHNDRDHGRFGPVMFERGDMPMPGGPNGEWGRGFPPPGGVLPPGDDGQDDDGQNDGSRSG